MKVVHCYRLNLTFMYYKLRWLDMGQNLQCIQLVNMTEQHAIRGKKIYGTTDPYGS